jgi:hypothetical protein
MHFFFFVVVVTNIRLVKRYSSVCQYVSVIDQIFRKIKFFVNDLWFISV